MSRPRSRSPRYRRFPWEEPDFDPYRVLAELDGSPLDRSHRPRDVPEEHLSYFREDTYSEGQRRSPPFAGDHQFRDRRPLDQEEFYRRRKSPNYDLMGCDHHRLSPLHDVGGDEERHRGGFREQFKSFENRGRSPHSTPRLTRERSLPASQSHSDHQQREPVMGWRREEQGRDRWRFRDLSPSARSDDKRREAGREREEGRRNPQGINKDRRREEPHQERNPPLKRQRREMDDTGHLGYRNEEKFGDKHYTLDTHRDRFRGDHQRSLPHIDSRHLGPLIIEHDHGITDSREPPQWEQYEERRGFDSDFDCQRSPRPMGYREERFRTSDNRMDDREDTRGYHFQDNLKDANYLDAKRSPVQQHRTNPMKYGNRDGPTNHKGKNGLRPMRGRLNNGQGDRTGLPRNQPRQISEGYRDLPHEKQRTGYQPFKENCYGDPTEQDCNWAEGDRLQQWEHDRLGSLDRHVPRNDSDLKMPHHRGRGWKDQKMNNMTIVTDETLTIKVDMSRPVNQNSSLCYSLDRQLSLDLVNVGRQRLDFLPMLEHSGTYRETAMHTGTFAQEIITLVHQVKEQYFRDDGLTLNERFSGPPKGGYSEEEMELTLDERFSSNRGFSLTMNSLLDDDIPLFSRLGSIQAVNQHPVRDPGDLRHDLERRRQERLEGVKVTIPGNSMSVHSLLPVSELGMEYSDKDEMQDKEFSKWPQDQSRRREGNMGQRRGDLFRLNTGHQRRNNRGGSRGGQMRRQNNRNNPAGANW